MKKTQLAGVVWFLWRVAVPCAGDPLTLAEPRPVGANVELIVRSTAPAPAAVEARLQRTRDLRSWENLGPKIKLPAGTVIDDWTIGADAGQQGFFRLVTRPTEFTSSDGAAVLGYAGSLADELESLGNFSIADFSQRFDRSEPYLPQLTWDPTTAEYWPQFNDPNPQGNRVTPGGIEKFPLPSLQLNTAELSAFRTNGFVVSARLGASNMADIYYDVFRRDLPVFVTTDSILHAWHRSYDAVLIDLEQEVLRSELATLLDGMANRIPEAVQAYGTGWRLARLQDADFLLSVGQNLLRGPLVAAPSKLGQESRVRTTATQVLNGVPLGVRLFPHRANELIDFSLFLPRGHYAGNDLGPYFRAMMWLGHIDLRVAGNPNYASPEDLGTALVLRDLLHRANLEATWERLETLLTTLVGPADSMNFRVLDELMAEAGVASLGDVPSLDDLRSLQARLESGQAGYQAIQGHSFEGSAGDGQIVLPRSFTFLGQRFTPDSWAFQQVVFDRIVEPGSEPTRLVRRRLPYSLDVAFSVFGNDHIVPELVANMVRKDGVPFRDGYPYQRNLTAVRQVMDALPTATWESSLYQRWLSALRSLSEPTTGSEYPEAMRTRAWALKTLNTQLASWTQLRHDNILYTEQSVTPPILCSYPHGFVEPRPVFYQRLRELADAARTQVVPFTASTKAKGIETFLARFATNCAMLEGISQAELSQLPLDAAQTHFLQNTIEWVSTYFGDRQYNGWFPLMFYRGAEGKPKPPWFPGGSTQKPPDHDSIQADYLVADVHTDGPSQVDGGPGGHPDPRRGPHESAPDRRGQRSGPNGLRRPGVVPLRVSKALRSASDGSGLDRAGHRRPDASSAPVDAKFPRSLNPNPAEAPPRITTNLQGSGPLNLQAR